MKTLLQKIKLTFFFLQLFLSVSAQNVWTQVADYAGDPRSACSSFSFSNSGFIGLGYDGVSYRRSFYKYIPLLDSWTQATSMGGTTGNGLERDVAASFTIGTKGYAGTGQGGAAYLGDFWEYDSVLDAWTQKANFGGSARRSAVGFAVGENGYIGLGQDASGFKKDVWKYDTLNNIWSQVADFPGTARRLAVAFSINDTAYIGTGDDGTFTNDFYAYDATNDNWIQKASFAGSPRYGAIGISFQERGYLGLGYDTSLNNTTDFWEYDPLTNAWVQKPDFPGAARANASSFTVGGALYVGMGYDTIQHNDIWAYGVITLLPEIAQQYSCSVFPNPVSNLAMISVTGLNDVHDPIIHVFNAAGKDFTLSVSSKLIMPLENEITLQTDFSNLLNGVYFFEVRGEGLKIAGGKFVVLH